MADVCLVSMPYALIENPSISIGLLKSILKRDGIDATCVYANIQFAQAIGTDVYNSVHQSPMSVFVQEWTFGGVAFPEFHPDHDAFLLRAFGPGPSGEALRETAWRLRAAAGGFIDRLAAAILAQRPKIVGCSSAFAQQVSSLALLRRIREREPGIVTMMGGPNCETEMGLAAHASYTWVDYVVSGEADELISDLCRALLMDRPLLGLLPYGVLGPEDRHSNYSAITNAANGNIPRATTRNFAGLPAPDYSDYFRAIDDANLRTQVRPRLLIETSRGCWWGARRQCTFCGQNTTAAGYRVKSSKQILDEFARLATEYQVRNFQMVDNMIGPTHLQEVLPAMEQMGAPYRVFCESKSTLKRSDVRRLRAAGVNVIQVGIESLDDRILRLLNKGTCAANNIQMLKWASEFGVVLAWNMLVKVPGEEDAWYGEMAGLIPLLSHLQPPSSILAVRFDRFSPYFEKRATYGIEMVPAQAYSSIYPGTPEQLAAQAFIFESPGRQTKDFDMDPARPCLSKALAASRKWQHEFWFFDPRLTMDDLGPVLRITDKRTPGSHVTRELSGMEREILLACDEGIGHTELSLGASLGHRPSTDTTQAVERLREFGLLVLVGGRLLSLPTRATAPFPDAADLPHGNTLPHRLRGPETVRKGAIKWKALVTK